MPEAGHSLESDGFDAETQRKVVRQRYASIASEADRESDGCCLASGCCGDDGGSDATAERIGYSSADLADAGDANLGLGCGNPTAIASLSAGETVLDLGSGGGFDCFLAAREVGRDGRIIGVDMTPEMIERARRTAAENDAENVEFRLGEIEHLPVPDSTIDVIISNCVVNLSPDKQQVFREAYRVLRPGGRLAISDVVLTAAVPVDVRADPDSVASCVAGAATMETLEWMLVNVGFADIDIAPKDESAKIIREWDSERDLSDFLVSATITGRKPRVNDVESEDGA